MAASIGFVVIAGMTPASAASAPEVTVAGGVSPVPGAVILWGGSQEKTPSGLDKDVVSVSAGSSHGLALTKQGRVVAFTYYSTGGNEYGEMDVPAEATSGVDAIAAGQNVSLAVKDGQVIAWGRPPSWGTNATNVPDEAKSGVVSVATNGHDALAVKSDGTVIQWGNSTWIGLPEKARHGVAAVDVASGYFAALTTAGEVITWNCGPQGTCTPGSAPVPADATSGVDAISAGQHHMLALKDGTVLAWWSSAAGEPEYSNKGQIDVPIEAQSGVIAIAAGNTSSVALKSNGSIIRWGGSTFGFEEVPPSLRADVTAVAASIEGGWQVAISTRPLTPDPEPGQASIWADCTRTKVTPGGSTKPKPGISCRGLTQGLPYYEKITVHLGSTPRAIKPLPANAEHTSASPSQAGGAFYWIAVLPRSLSKAKNVYVKFTQGRTSSPAIKASGR